MGKAYVNDQNLLCPQVVYYDAGVATADLIDSKIAGAYPASVNLYYTRRIYARIGITQVLLSAFLDQSDHFHTPAAVIL